MSKWWESERSLQAARIRSTRRRLRASLRATRRQDSKRLEAERRRAILNADARAELVEQRCYDVMAELARIRPFVTASAGKALDHFACEMRVDRRVLDYMNRHGQRIFAEYVGRALAAKILIAITEQRDGPL